MAFNPLLLALATIPPLLFVPIVRGKPERIGKEIIYLGCLGGCLAGISILMFKIFFLKGTLKYPSSESLTIALFISFIEAGFLEELFKSAFFILAVYFLKFFRQQPLQGYDYFALGAFIGLGFGISENAWYAISPQFSKLEIILGRVYTTIPAHMMMSIIFGFLKAKKYPYVLALLASILAHGLYDFFAIPGLIFGGSPLLAVILLKAMLIVGFGFSLWAGKFLWQGKTESLSFA